MDSYLITGATGEGWREKAREISTNKYQISDLDTLFFDPEISMGIDLVRELEHKISLKPYQGKMKSVIIHGAEKLTLEAQNAILKTLEEPPPNTILILTVPNEDFLLPTIVSRCQIIHLPPIQRELPKEIFLSYCQSLGRIIRSGVGERIRFAGEIAKTREEMIKWLEELISIMRQVLLGKLQITASPPAPIPYGSGPAGELTAKNQINLSPKQLVLIIHRALRTKRMIEKNVNFRLALEIFLFSLPKLG